MNREELFFFGTLLATLPWHCRYKRNAQQVLDNRIHIPSCIMEAELIRQSPPKHRPLERYSATVSRPVRSLKFITSSYKSIQV